MTNAVTHYRDMVAIADACDIIARRCVTIANGYHGPAWLFDRVNRAFDNPSIVGITYPVYVNLVGDRYVTIPRDGRFFIHNDPEFDLG